MIPIKLLLHNFTSYGSAMEPLDLTKFHIACLTGENGAGKSSILDSITYAVWGQARAKSPDELVRLGTNEMSVDFEFELDGHCYKIKRGRNIKRNTTTLELFLTKPNHANITEGTIKDTQIKIDQILKMSYETFINSAYLKQGHADEFTLKGPTDRKRILAEILGLGYYDELESRAKEKVKEYLLETKNLEMQISEIETELLESDVRKTQLDNAKEKVKVAENAIAEKEKQLKTENQRYQELNLAFTMYQKLKENLNRIRNEYQKLALDIKERQEKFNEDEKLLKNRDLIEKNYQILLEKRKENEKLNETQTELLKLTREKQNITSQVSQISTQIKHLEELVLTLLNQIKTLHEKEAKCPLCGSTLEDKHKKDLLEKLKIEKEEKVKEIEKFKSSPPTEKLEQLEKSVNALSYDEKLHLQIKNQITSLLTFEQQKMELEAKVAQHKTEKTILSEKLIEFKKKKEEGFKAKKEFEKYQDVSQTLTEIKENIEKLEEELTDLRQIEKEARSVMGAATQLVERSQQLQKLKEKKVKQKEEFTEKKTIYEELTLAFGKRGIQAMIIETAIPEIESVTNQLLDKMTDGRMRITLQTQKETKTTGDIVETLDIIISDEMGARSYELYSGGETFRVNFALRLALSKLLTHRAGAKLQFLVIDEGFGTQDALGQERLIQAINSIKDEFAKILVVTHIEELKDAFPVRIEVIKKTNGSITQVVGA